MVIHIHLIVHYYTQTILFKSLHIIIATYTLKIKTSYMLIDIIHVQ